LYELDCRKSRQVTLVATLIVAGEENIFGDIRPVENIIEQVHIRTLQPLDSSLIQNFFVSFINGEARLFPCKTHQKIEGERRDELNHKG
jgi:hypothetical protein